MTDQPKPPKPAPHSDVKWLPVKNIAFAGQLALPGCATATFLRGDVTQANVPRWAIDYAPSLRHFRIVFATADANKEPEVRMVPEGAVKSWEPMPGS